MGKPNRVQDDLMMTIASDDELSEVEASSDEENEEETVLKDAIISKKQMEQEELAANKNKLIAEDFQFDDGDGFRGTSGSSWDFTKAISRIEKMERMENGPSKRTSIQTKIENRKKEKQAAKVAKLAKKTISQPSSHDSNEEEESDDEEPESGEEEQVESGEEQDEDEEMDKTEAEETDEEVQQEDVVIEEERLMAAIRENRKNQKAHEEQVDALEQRRAQEFFEADPFAAEEFAKTKFETFADLKLSRPLMRAISELGFEKPTPIQQRAIPIALTGKDICASAQTGSGKTAAFLLPILERLQFRSRRVQSTRVLIICPVRELATQCQSMLEQLGRFTDITSTLAVGGLPLKAQEVELRARPDVVICTPGRMIDHLRNSKSIHMDELEILVLDEADRLLELGFTEEVLELVRMCPIARQTMLFSATLTSKIDQLIELSMKRPVRISTDPLFDMAKHLVQEFVRIRPQRESDREAILLALCTRTFRTNTIVFMETKVHAHRMMIIFGLAGLKAAELHGNLTQKERLEALQQFRDGSVDLLLCTDVAARGIDVKGVHAVINYEMPKDLTTYVHRVGRTARAGRNGRAVTLTSEKRRLLMKQVSRHCHGFVKSRAVPDPVIAQWKARIEGMDQDIKAIMREETLEKRMREAEQEATRASNLLKHHDEIQSRPARTWFLNEKEKKKVQERAEQARLETLEKEEESGKDQLKHMNRKKRRRFELMEQEQQAYEDAAQTKPVFTNQHVAAAAKHAKKDKRLKTMYREEESIAETHERKRLKREQVRSLKSSHSQRSNGFEVDYSAKDGQPLHTKASRRTGNHSEAFEFKEKLTHYKKHAKKGTSSFKSKRRFQRR